MSWKDWLLNRSELLKGWTTNEFAMVVKNCYGLELQTTINELLKPRRMNYWRLLTNDYQWITKTLRDDWRKEELLKHERTCEVKDYWRKKITTAKGNKEILNMKRMNYLIRKVAYFLLIVKNVSSCFLGPCSMKESNTEWWRRTTLSNSYQILDK